MNEMQWSPFIEGQWIARVPADHACHTITVVNEITWMTWLWSNYGMKSVVGGKLEKLQENLPRPHFTYQKTHIEWPRCELIIPAVREQLTACATGLICYNEMTQLLFLLTQISVDGAPYYYFKHRMDPEKIIRLRSGTEELQDFCYTVSINLN